MHYSLKGMTTECPRCGSVAALDHCDEADVGVGIITGNHVWYCAKCDALFDDDGRFDDEQPRWPDPMAGAVSDLFSGLAKSAGEAGMAFEIADMGVFREACLRAADGEPFALPAGMAKVKK